MYEGLPRDNDCSTLFEADDFVSDNATLSGNRLHSIGIRQGEFNKLKVRDISMHALSNTVVEPPEGGGPERAASRLKCGAFAL